MQHNNVLLIIVDCARSEKTIIDLPQASPWTRRSAHLPFLDHLQRLGTTWTDLNAVSSTTTPNLASIFTGLLPVHHGILEHSRHSLRIDVPTVAELLSRVGYHTYAEVTGPLVAEAGLGRGFSHYRCRERSEYLHTGLLDNLEPLVESLEAPWFFCLHLWEAHMPYQDPRPFTTMQSGYTPYDRALTFIDESLLRLFRQLDMDRTRVIYTADHGERLESDYELNRELGGTDAAALEAYQRFCAEEPGAFAFDRWFELMQREFGEIWARIYAHNVLGHGFHLTEDLIRVPLVVAAPDLCPAGEVRGDLRSQVDLGATILDLAGVEITGEDRLAGRSLLERGDEELLYIEANGSGGMQFSNRCFLRGARSRRWKYWRIEGGDLTHQVLWDMIEDPRETRDVAAEHPDVCTRFSQFIDRSLEDRYSVPAATLDDVAGDAIEHRLKELGYL